MAAPLLEKDAIALQKKSFGHKALKQVCNWHKITWEILKGSVSFHQEQSREEDVPGKSENIYTLKHVCD